jgi:NAD+ kinase
MNIVFPAPTRLAVVYHPHLKEAESEAPIVADFLRQQGLQSIFCTSLYNPELPDMLREQRFEILIALGGDGTMLRAGRLCAPCSVPIFGINTGKFGFLIEGKRKQWRDQIPLLLEGKFRLEKRMMLRAGHWRGDTLLGEWDVLNEAAVCRGHLVRPIRLKASVDGYEMATYVADGLIASTPTGSTGYALAVGGPVMPPELHNILIIPIAPHLSLDRAIILQEGASVSITVATNHEAVLSVDGQPPVPMQNGDELRAAAGDHVASFVRFQDPSYFYRNLANYMEQNPSANGA